MKKYDSLNVIKWYEYKAFVKVNHDESLLEGHWHHIVPKHLGGTNDDGNLVRLKRGDHQKAHLMLAECFEGDTDAYLSNMRSARILGASISIDLMKGSNNPFYGKTHTAEVRSKLSARTKEALTGLDYQGRYGNRAITEREKRSASVKRRHEGRSEEEKLAISDKIKTALYDQPESERSARSRKAALARTTKIKINDKVFECIKDACNCLNVTKYFLFKDYNVERIYE